MQSPRKVNTGSKLKPRAVLLFNEIAERFVKCQREENIGDVLERNVLADCWNKADRRVSGNNTLQQLRERERERVTVVACPSQFGGRGRVMWKCSSRMDLGSGPGENMSNRGHL